MDDVGRFQQPVHKIEACADTGVVGNDEDSFGAGLERASDLIGRMARQYGEQSFKKSDEAVNLADEMADVLFVLICLANQTGIDLTEALEKNMQKKQIRDADRHKNNEKLK